MSLSPPFVSTSAELQPPTISQRETNRWRVDHLRAYERMKDEDLLDYWFQENSYATSVVYWKRVTGKVSSTGSKSQQCEAGVSRP